MSGFSFSFQIHNVNFSLKVVPVNQQLWRLVTYLDIAAFQIALLTSYTFFWLSLAKVNLCIFGMDLNFGKSQQS